MAKQNSSGGKDKLGSISKQGDRYLRSLFTIGAHEPWRPVLKVLPTPQLPSRMAQFDPNAKYSQIPGRSRLPGVCPLDNAQSVQLTSRLVRGSRRRGLRWCEY